MSCYLNFFYYCFIFFCCHDCLFSWSVGSVKIDKPCLNIVGMLHPKAACSFLDGEKGDCNDGMWARFHFCMQAPIFPKMLENQFTPNGNIPSLERWKHHVFDIICSMSVLKYFILSICIWPNEIFYDHCLISYCRLLYVISVIHENRQTYTYSPAARSQVKEYYDKIQTTLSDHHFEDDFLTSK